MNKYSFISKQLALALAFSAGVMGFAPAAYAETKAANEIKAAEAESASTVYLTLEEALVMAAKNNRNIHLAEYAKDLAKWQRAELRRTHGITVSVEGKAGRIDGRAYNAPRSTGTVKYKHDYSGTASASFPIFTGGQLENSIKAADYSYDAANLSLEATKQTIRQVTTAAYYGVLHCFNLVKVNSDSVETLREHQKNVDAAYAVGTVAKNDVLRSQVQLASAEQAFTNALNDYYVAVSQLNNIIGLPTENDTRPTDEMTYKGYDLQLDKCLEYAMSHRPDGIAAQRKAKAARHALSAAKGAAMPEIAIVANRSVSGEHINNTNHDNGNSWFAGVAASWDVFDNGINRAKVHQAKAQYQQALEAAEQQQESIRLEVREAFLDMLAAEQNIMTAGKAVEQAKEDFKIASLRYDSGIGTHIDVMDAEDNLNKARTNYAVALYSYNIGKAELDRAMGIAVDLDVNAYIMDKHAVPLKNSKYRKAKEQEGYESAVGEVPDGAKETGEVQTAVPVSGRTIGWPAPAPNENPRG